MKTLTLNPVEENFLQHKTTKMIITAKGKLVILNGGSSAAEGGMGSGSKSGTERGEVNSDNEKTPGKSDKDADIELENTFDPLKKEIEKKEQEK